MVRQTADYKSLVSRVHDPYVDEILTNFVVFVVHNIKLEFLNSDDLFDQIDVSINPKISFIEILSDNKTYCVSKVLSKDNRKYRIKQLHNKKLSLSYCLSSKSDSRFIIHFTHKIKSLLQIKFKYNIY